MQSKGVIGKLERRMALKLERRLAEIRLGAPTVSFTFDDVPQSACLQGRSVMEARDALGTYYVCGGFTGTVREVPMHTLADLRGLMQAGHEIACHGYGHCDHQAMAVAAAADDMDRNLQFLQDIGAAAPGRLNFAYPFGCVNAGVKRLTSDRYLSARGVTGGLHSGQADLNLIGAVPLYASRLSPADVTALIERNAREGGWLVFFTHGVAEQPSAYDCTPRLLDHALQVARATGSRVQTMRAVLGEDPLSKGIRGQARSHDDARSRQAPRRRVNEARAA